MFGSATTSALSLGKIISGITKTLGVANQVIPIYKEVKPMISNAKNMFSIVKEFGLSSKNNSKPDSNLISKTSIKTVLNDKPVFFQ